MCIQCICVQWYDMYKYVNVNKCVYIYIYVYISTCTTIYIRPQSFLESKGMNITHNIQHHNARDFHHSRIANIQNWETSLKIYRFWDTVAKDLKKCFSTTGRFCLHMFASVFLMVLHILYTCSATNATCCDKPHSGHQETASCCKADLPGVATNSSHPSKHWRQSR